MTQRRIVAALLALADLSVLALAFRVAQWTADSTWVSPWSTSSDTPSLKLHLLLWLAIIFPILKVRGLYRFRYRDGIYSSARAAASVLLAGAIYVVLVFLADVPTGRVFVVLAVAYSAVLLTGFRRFFGWLAARLPPLSRRVLVVGSGPVAESTGRMICQYRSRALCLISPSSEDQSQSAIHDGAQFKPWVLDSDDLAQIARHVQALAIDDVVITRNWYERNCPDVEHAFRMLTLLPAQVHVAPDPAELMMRMSVEDFSGLPVVSLGTLSLSRWQLLVKRAFDIVVSASLLLISSPLLLAIALVIRVTTPGPALFRQKRVGMNHRIFTIYKFRTMYVGDPPAPREGVPHKRRGDPRITPFGRWLRRTSLDELPQLINVLKGDMALVGPRPELPEIAATYEPWQYGRLLVPQGITGWWQVNGRGERLLHKHTEDDIYYVRNFSLLLDARILLKTFRALVTGRGAF